VERKRALTAVLLALLGLAPRGAASADAIHYTLRYDPAAPGLVEVEIRPGSLPLPQTVAIPRAIPMGYGEQPYDRFVEDLAAFAEDGTALPVRRGEGPRWVVGGESGRLEQLHYRVDVRRLEREVRSAADASKARPGYLGLLGYSVLAFLEGQEASPVRLRVEGPGSWPVFSTLAPAAPPPLGSLEAAAEDYYSLADSQVLMGPDLRVRRGAGEPPLFVAAYAEGALEAAVVAATGREALDALTAWFGTTPFPYYTIVVEVLRPISPEHEYGFSMEHLQSGTFFLDDTRGALTADSSPRQLERARYNYAHHIAHSWIPKRCAGEGYFPFPWTKAPILDTIWFSEGFPQYVAAAALAESTPTAGDEFVARLVEQRFRRTLEETPTFIREMDTVALSRLASTRYSEDFRTGANSFSRGGMMAREMDLRIREHSGGQRSLRDALRHLFDACAAGGRPLGIDEIPELLSAGSGLELRDIYDRWMAAPASR